MAQFYDLKAGHTLSVTVREGRAHVRSVDGADNAFSRSSVSFGPYLVDRQFLVDGDVTVAMAADTSSVRSLIMSNDGAPDAAAQATVTVNPTGDDNSLVFTARAYGAEGNGITVAYVDPSANDAALEVSVYRQAISVSLATGSGGAITSTAAEVKAAIEAHGLANELVTVALDDSDTNFDSGAGVVTAMAADALEGGAGTGIGVIVAGGICIDTGNGVVYRNSGSLAAPAWTALADAS